MTNRWTRCWTKYFNPRSREGSDVSRREHLVWTSYFNPRSREGSDACARFSRRVAIDFNPRSREGSDAGGPRIPLTDKISIHAPVKGATYYSQRHFCRRLISIHAPAKGATHGTRARQRSHGFQSTLPRRERLRPELSHHRNQHFNPRSREGSDQRVERHKEITGEDYNKYFNPRSREGSDAERDR